MVILPIKYQRIPCYHFQVFYHPYQCVAVLLSDLHFSLLERITWSVYQGYSEYHFGCKKFHTKEDTQITMNGIFIKKTKKKFCFLRGNYYEYFKEMEKVYIERSDERY